MRRRAFLALPFAAAGLARAYDPVARGTALAFPRDRGAHPGHRIEWWYVTGQLEGSPAPTGFQVTFFRVRNKAGEAMRGRFAPGQLLFAHAAISDPSAGRIHHDQRSARMLGDLVRAREGETDLRLDDWWLRREGDGYRAQVAGDGIALDLALKPTQPVLLQGDAGFSRKGPRPEQASFYYSEPHLAAEGTIAVAGRGRKVRGSAWLDHEWSSELLDPSASGWDWLGANLEGGGALTAFRVREASGATVWSSALRRDPGQAPQRWEGDAVAFAASRTWRSQRTGVAYPVAMEITIGGAPWKVTPLFDDQELDARASTGTLYWEGAVQVAGPGGIKGRGYLELTGYAERVPF
jgi:predicted secreted hydrolase